MVLVLASLMFALASGCEAGDNVNLGGRSLKCVAVKSEGIASKVHIYYALKDDATVTIALGCKPSPSDLPMWCAMGFGTGMGLPGKKATVVNSVANRGDIPIRKQAYVVQNMAPGAEVPDFISNWESEEVDGASFTYFDIPVKNLVGDLENASLVWSYTDRSADYKTMKHTQRGKFCFNFDDPTDGCSGASRSSPLVPFLLVLLALI